VAEDDAGVKMESQFGARSGGYTMAMMLVRRSHACATSCPARPSC